MGADTGISHGFCATHPSRRGNTVCQRCGDFACEDCYAIAPDGTDLCTRCLTNLPLPAPLASRFWGEVIDVGAFTSTIALGLALRDLAETSAMGWALAAFPVLA